MSDNSFDPEEWRAELERERERKDEYFTSHPNSPIPADQREGFDGLNYYQPDPEYRFVLPLHEHDEKETITVETTTEGEREYFRWGEFRFEIDDEQITLQAYKADPDEDRLWVPFRDETSRAGETYGAGRYVDLEADEHKVNDEWVLDLNEAYNPLCAYSAAYECPLIPTENWIDVRIEAGEKNYESPHGHPAEH